MSHDAKDQTFDRPAHVEQKESSDHFEDTKLPVNDGLNQVRDVSTSISWDADFQGELQEALRESEIKRWSRTSVHMYLAVFIGFLCSCANGYDGSLFSGILSMPYFQSTFGSGIDGPKVSLIASLYTV